MKKILFLLIMLPIAAIGQKCELGLNIGACTNTIPTGTIYYIGNKYSINTDFSIYCLKKASIADITIGVGIYGVELANGSSRVYDYFGTNIGNNGLKFIYANFAYSVRPIINYTYFKHRNQYYYVSASAGPCLTSAERQTPKNSDGSKITFRGIDGGIGYTGGLHLGMDINFSVRMAVNIAAGAEYYNLKFSPSETFPTGRNVNLQTIAYPFSIGIKYKIGYEKHLDYETGKFIIVRPTNTNEGKK